ncbi:hypothetical protein [Botrimarina sp.]|uniref:hypothetical protein n=1 Tax=Botrimarina sp. TaxID=2795802 RepID=UPI0032EBB439
MTFTRCFLAAAALLLTIPAQAIALIETLPRSPFGIGGTAPATVTYFSQPFSLKQDVTNFQLDLYAGTFETVQTNYIISNQIGPGTTQANIIAESSLPSQSFAAGVITQSGTLTTVFDPSEVPSIAAGDYWLTLAIERPFSGTGWTFQYSNVNPADNEFATIPGGILQARDSVPAFQVGDANRDDPEASVFELFSPQAIRMRISGDVVTDRPSVPIPGGNEGFFDFQPPAIDGVGVTVGDLGADHGVDSQSIGGSENTEVSSLSRTFRFDTSEGADPVDIYLHAALDGRLLADNFSEASAEALLQILDSDGEVISEDRAFVEVEALGGVFKEADVFETLTTAASLTPGVDYTIFSRLTLHTRAGLDGAARAFFADTFEYVISGESANPFARIPEPASAALLGMAAAPLCRRRRVACC